MAQANYVNNAIRALITGAGAEPSTNPVRGAHAELLVCLAGQPPRLIPLKPPVIDLEDRADGLNKVLNARRDLIGGSDARTVMGDDEGALLQLWHELKEVRRRIAVPGGWGAALTNPEKSMVALGDNGASLDRVWPEEHHSGYLRLRDFRKRTPSPPPFSSMNSMPAASIAR